MASLMTSDSTAEPAVNSRPATLWARLVGTFFGIGYLRPGPGTWASLATIGIWSALAPFLSPPIQPVMACIAAVVVTGAGVPAASRVARAGGKSDPSEVVIDEVAGQMIAVIGAPLHWKSVLAGLILFRAFDILKPPPLRRLERLPGGLGIVADDVGAGLYALAILQVLLHYRLLS